MPVESAEPLELGTRVKPYGRVGAVLFTGGERYYMLIGKHGAVALMPAIDIEPLAKRAITNHHGE